MKKTFYIGNLEIKGILILAPMCNVTSLPFRLICKKYGASLVYSEMIHSEAFLQESDKSYKKAFFLNKEKPIGVQLSGSCVDSLVKAAKKVEKILKPDLIDLNIGCPAYSVIKCGAGSELLKDKNKIKEIVSKISSSIKIPLTCKIRILNDEKETIEIAKLIEKNGAKALTVHGRTQKQGYSGKANWQIIKKIKSLLKIPVILNGDVKDEESAKKALETNVDALMIGRAAIGNPFVFKRINYFLETGKKLPKQTFTDKINDFKEFVNLCEKYNYLNITYIKFQATNFAKEFTGASLLRDKISKAKDYKEIINLMEDIKNID
ncbi:MAG: tRNA dihydrouridine synthase DusB [Candidatus Woesearchaeota archaeon]